MISLYLLVAAFAAYLPFAAATTYTVPTLINVLDNSKAEFTSLAIGLDGPKLDLVNATTFDWWYFDAVAPDGNTQFTVIAGTGDVLSIGYPLSTTGFAAWVLVTAVLPNGEMYELRIYSNGATIDVQSQGSSGVWVGTGLSWVGAPDMSSYVLTIDNAVLGIKGSVKFNSIAPAHYVCSPAVAGQSEVMLPHLGWANAVPDAVATVDMTVGMLLGLGGTRLQFTGSGYHDKNWGDQRLTVSVNTWYWGHARLGPYSIVWFDAIAPSGENRVSGYIAKDGKIMERTCSNFSVRPTGRYSQYPPAAGQPDPDGFHIEWNFADGRKFVMDVQNRKLSWKPLLLQGALTRWTGFATGGFVGQQQYQGPTMHEWMRFWINI